ncbi:hypothetical protein DL770_006667 [Monosporascus sp. CRB-9-2]|nr:hypothetical protein DL770_006667 [Monosporascus sp. CRB-9-2]
METIEVLYVPEHPKDRLEVLKREDRNIAFLAKRSEKEGHIPSGAEVDRRFRALRMYLDWMQANLEMTPKIKAQTNMDQYLKVMFEKPETYHFPEDIRDKAKALYDEWSSENWGADAVLDDEAAADEEAGAAAPLAGETPTTQVVLPARNDPIFGEGGILYGVYKTRGPKGGITYTVNGAIKRNAKVFGHNGIAPGTWYPLQIVALARGAHGARIAGIAGDTALGAYSIVVSDKYEDLDRDEGSRLFYSGSNSHRNDDPTRPAESSTGTKALKASLNNGHPVRVLRSGGPGSKNRWAPDRGIRYDGLYRVVRRLTPLNTRGGMYEQFELQRLEGQEPLRDICQRSPTPQQKFDWDRIQQGS